MPIVVRRGRPIAEPRSRLLRFERPTGAGSAATAIGSPPDEPHPRHELARLALDLVVRIAAPSDIPTGWTTGSFGLEVERTRAQLGPIRSRAGLLASFSREASVAATRGPVPVSLPAGHVRVAYAIRWLELGDGRPRPDWPFFVGSPPALQPPGVGPAKAASANKLLAHRNGEITT